MDISEVLTKKMQASIQITEIIRNLVTETGCVFDSICAIEMDSKCGTDFIFEVKLKLR